MWTRLKTLLAAGQSPEGPGISPLERAAAGLLVTLAVADQDFAEEERVAILSILERRYGQSPAAAEELLAIARQDVAQAVDLHRFVQPLCAEFGPAERLSLIELLWEVVLADQVLEIHEAALMRQLAGLLGISDRDSALARQRVQARQQGGGG